MDSWKDIFNVSLRDTENLFDESLGRKYQVYSEVQNWSRDLQFRMAACFCCKPISFIKHSTSSTYHRIGQS